MKYLLLLIFIFSSQYALASSNATKTFLLLGQSNMAGRGNVAELAPHLKRLPANITFFLHGKAVDIARQPKFGPEVSLAHELAKMYPNKKINLVKFAPGGSMMRDWLRGRPHYQTMNKMLGRIRKNHTLDISAVLWMHGERDTKSMSTAGSYQKDLARFIQTLRQDKNKPNLPFVIAQISVPEAFRPAEIKTVKKAQQDTARSLPSVQVFSTEQLSKRSDQTHYDTSGQIKLGQLFARYLRKH